MDNENELYKSVTKISLETGEASEMYKAPFATFLLGTKDENLVLKSITSDYVAPLGSSVIGSEEFVNSQFHEVFTLNTSNNELASIEKWKQTDNKAAFVNENELIIIDEISKIITGKSSNETVQVTDFSDIASDGTNLYVDGFCDDNILLRAISVVNNTEELWSVNLSSGSKQQIRLTYYDGNKNMKRPITIFACYGENVLVSGDSEKLVLNITDNKGNIVAQDYYASTFNLMSKNDFFSSAENYNKIALAK